MASNNNMTRDEIFESALDRIGSSWLYDSIYLFVFPPIGVASFIGNLVSIWIFSSPVFAQKPLYTYLKVSCLNSTPLNLVLSINFIWNARRYFDMSNTEWALWLRCYLKHPIMFTTYSLGSMLDIVLALERLCELTNTRRLFQQFEPKRVCIVLFLVSLLLNLPLFFVFEPQTEILVIDAEANITEAFHHIGLSAFSQTPQGTMLNNIHYFVRDVLSLIVLIAINLVAFILFRQKYHRYVDLRAPGRQFLSVRFQSGDSNCDSGREVRDRIDQKRSDEAVLVFKRHNKSRVYIRVALANKMLTKMVFIICLFSTFEHLFLILSINLFELYLKPFKVLIIISANLVMLLKHSINFFIFYTFNNLFRARFWRIFSFDNSN